MSRWPCPRRYSDIAADSMLSDSTTVRTSIAFYPGTLSTTNSTTRVLMDASKRAQRFGSRMRFAPATIDKAGKQVAEALHGRWMAPVSGYDQPDVALLLGIGYPTIAYQGVPRGNPAAWLRQQIDRGMQLLGHRPRSTESGETGQHPPAAAAGA